MAYNTVTVTGTPTLIVAANTNRTSLIISNTSTLSSVFFGPDSSITVGNCPELQKASSFTEDSSGTSMYKGPIWGVSAGSIDVRYWERTDSR